jgi:hypothetical protein
MDANAFAAFVFVLILLLSVLGAHWIHTKHIKYATEGSLALLLGFAITGLICGTYYAAHKQPLPAHWIRFNDTLIFEVRSRPGVHKHLLEQQRALRRGLPQHTASMPEVLSEGWSRLQCCTLNLNITVFAGAAASHHLLRGLQPQEEAVLPGGWGGVGLPKFFQVGGVGSCR